jgi:hypothetical protein
LTAAEARFKNPGQIGVPSAEIDRPAAFPLQCCAAYCRLYQESEDLFRLAVSNAKLMMNFALPGQRRRDLRTMRYCFSTIGLFISNYVARTLALSISLNFSLSEKTLPAVLNACCVKPQARCNGSPQPALTTWPDE